MRFLKYYFSSSIFRINLAIVVASLSEAAFFIYALNTNLTPYKIVTIGMLIAIVVGALGSFLYYAPFQRFKSFLKKNQYKPNLKIPSSGLQDMDEIICLINDSLHASSDILTKFSCLLDLSGRDMALFEIRNDSSKVYVTHRFFPLLDENERSLEKSGFITLSAFKTKIKKLEQHLIPNYSDKFSNIYHFATSNNTSRWVRITTSQMDDSTLGLIEDVSDEMLKKTQLEYERDYDILTSLLNRRAFIARVKSLFAAPSQLKTAAFVSIDLDKLKYVNDTRGHDYGDEYIKIFASVLTSSLPKGSIISRFGGDEFLAFLYGFDSEEEIKHEIVKLNVAIDRATLSFPDGDILNLSASGGIAFYPRHSSSAAHLMRYADYAMYTVKKGTRGVFAEFSIYDYEQNVYCTEASDSIRNFIEGKLYQYEFEPIVDAKTGALFAYESILKSNDPQIPNENALIALANTEEELQFLEHFIVSESLEAFNKLDDKDHIKLFMNTIPNQVLYEDFFSTIVNKYQSIIKNIAVQARMNIDFFNISKTKMEMITKVGGVLSLSGYGAEQHDELLDDLKPEFLKLDASLTKNIEAASNKFQLIASLISSAHQKNIKIIAEDVATPADAAALISLGVDYLQGPYVAKPSTKPPKRMAIVEAQIKNMAKNKKNIQLDGNAFNSAIKGLHNPITFLIQTAENVV